MSVTYPSVVELFGSLKLLKVRFQCVLEREGRLPRYLGSSWRGVLGQGLRRNICPFPEQRSCSGCVIRDHCPYYCLYEKASDISGFKDNPRPYILNPLPTLTRQGEREAAVTITLIGRAVEYLPVVWQAMAMASKIGLGAERISFSIRQCEQADPDGWLDLPTTSDGYQSATAPLPLSRWLTTARPLPWEFVFETPVRLRRQGIYLSTIDWPFFFGTIAKRLEMLSVVFQGAVTMGAPAWNRLQDLFSQPCRIATSLNWRDWERYSNRQQRKVPMGGLVGRVTVSQACDAWWDWWQAACLVGIGKGTAMGLGLIHQMDHDATTSNSDQSYITSKPALS